MSQNSLQDIKESTNVTELCVGESTQSQNCVQDMKESLMSQNCVQDMKESTNVTELRVGHEGSHRTACRI